MASTNNERIKKFDGSERHDWPDFATKMIAYVGLKGGWDDALEKKLDMKDDANVKLNKQAWSYLAIMLEDEALSELDTITWKDVYKAWQHLITKYEPIDDKAHLLLLASNPQCTTMLSQ